MYKRFRTDLAAEQRELTEGAGSLKGVRASSETRRGFEVTTVEILDREGEKALCKPATASASRTPQNSWPNCCAAFSRPIMAPALSSPASGTTK